MSNRGRWYGGGPMSDYPEQGPIQTDGFARRVRREGRATLPMPILEMAGDEYHNHHGHNQTLQRLNERGGLGILEVVALLADRCERLAGEER